MKNLVAILTLVFLIACKKEHRKSEAPDINNTTWEIMSNPTDPMFARVKTDTNQIEFYGDRNQDGLPEKLRLFIVKNRRDTVYFRLDDEGRPLSIQNTSGFEYRYEWKSRSEADLTVISTGQDTISTALKVDGVSKTGSTLFAASNATQNLQSNITVKFTKCGKSELKYLGEVGVALSLVQGSQDITYLPVNYSNGKYSASLPVETSVSIVPSPAICDKIIKVISAACNLPEPGGNAILVASCVAIDIALVASGAGAPAAAVFAGYCANLVANFNAYCLINSIVDNGEICNAKYIKRIYNQGIYLQPFIYSGGKKISGERVSTIGGSQAIELNLEINECDPGEVLMGSRYVLTSWRYGASIPGMVNFQSPSNPPYFTYEPGQEFYFDKEATFTVTSYNVPPQPNSSASGFPYRIGAYSPDSLFLRTPGSDATNSYGHQYPEGWGLKLPPGYDLFILNDYFPSRLTKDGKYIYRGDHGDMIYKK
jgi:hypothetical protein